MPSLFVIQGRDQGKRFELQGPCVRIGREKGNTVQLHDTEVSRFHAELHWQDGRYDLVDLGSSNGTYVNSQLARASRAEQRGPRAARTHADDLHRRRRTGVPRSGGRCRYRGSESADEWLADRQYDGPAGGQPDLRPGGGLRESLVGPCPQQSGRHVPHGAGRQPHAGHRSAAATDRGADFRMGGGGSRLRDAAGPRHAISWCPRCVATARPRRARRWRSAARSWTTSCSTTRGC